MSVLIGLIILVVFLEISIRTSSFLFSVYQDHKNQVHFKNNNYKKTITIVTIGESTTAVAANESNTLLVQETAYPYYLEKYLNEAQTQFNFVVINKGIMGGHTRKIISELTKYLKDHKPDIIIAMMGMKDTKDLGGSSGGKISRWEVVDEALQNFRVYNLVCLHYNQYDLKNSHIDDSKLVEKYDDLSLDFLNDNKRDINQDIYYHFATDTISDDLLKTLIKEHSLGNYFMRTGQYKKAESIFKSTITKFKML